MSTDARHPIGECTNAFDSNLEKLINPENVSTPPTNSILIWMDANISSSSPDDQNSFQKLSHVTKSIAMFTDAEKCRTFIDKFQNDRKHVFLIVSGSFGKYFVPNINDISGVISIYIFCSIKRNHETWAKQYEKVKVVSNNIDDVCKYLEYDTQNYQTNEIINENERIVPLQESPLPYQPNEILELSENNFRYDQSNDDIQIPSASVNIPCCIEEIILSTVELNITNQLASSQTVSPFYSYEQQMDFSDGGIWPCILVVGNPQNSAINYLIARIRDIKSTSSIEYAVQHIRKHRESPHFIVLCESADIEHINKLIGRVRQLYIYNPTNQIRHDANQWCQTFPNIASVLEDISPLARMMLWDLSMCTQDIGAAYRMENRITLAQTRYLYAYRLHMMIREDIKHQLQIARAPEQ